MIKRFSISDVNGLVRLYNESMREDPDFRPLNYEEFQYRYLELPYETIALVSSSGSTIDGGIIADVDPLMEKKFGRKISVVDLMVAKKDNFLEISKSLISALEQSLKQLGVEEIQFHFVAENMKDVQEVLFASGFEQSRIWYYMERDVEQIDLPDLPSGFKWDHIRFRGKYANARKWLECHNKAFETHYGMRPLRYEELKSYLFEESFDPTGYFGIYEIGKRRFVAQCSCEVDTKLNEYQMASKGVIWTVGVLEEMRGRGFGKLLVMKAINWLYSKGVKRAAIHVDSLNERAFNIYSNLGFKILRKRLFYSKTL